VEVDVSGIRRQDKKKDNLLNPQIEKNIDAKTN
jgi:hypothetical protein